MCGRACYQNNSTASWACLRHKWAVQLAQCSAITALVRLARVLVLRVFYVAIGHKVTAIQESSCTVLPVLLICR